MTNNVFRGIAAIGFMIMALGALIGGSYTDMIIAIFAMMYFIDRLESRPKGHKGG